MSKKSVMKSAKMTGISASVSASARLLGASASPIVEKSPESGIVDDAVGPVEHAEDRGRATVRGRDAGEQRAAHARAPTSTIATRMPSRARSAAARRQVAQADAGGRVVDDDAALAQPDERDEEADADADRELHRRAARRARPPRAGRPARARTRSAPSITTQAMPTCQGSSRPMMMSKATTALRPRPEASANGKFASRPMAP